MKIENCDQRPPFTSRGSWEMRVTIFRHAGEPEAGLTELFSQDNLRDGRTKRQGEVLSESTLDTLGVQAVVTKGRRRELSIHLLRFVKSLKKKYTCKHDPTAFKKIAG